MDTNRRNPMVDWTAIAALVLLGAAVRLVLRDLPNFAPVAALALFAGYWSGSARKAVLVPLGVMLLSDTWIAGYPRHLGGLLVMLTVYSALALPALFGPWLRTRLSLQGGGGVGSWCGLLGASLLGSLTFFAATNLATWLWFDLYPHTAAGLGRCFLQALPFFRATLAGDLLFGTALFGAYAASCSLAARPSSPRTTP